MGYDKKTIAELIDKFLEQQEKEATEKAAAQKAAAEPAPEMQESEEASAPRRDYTLTTEDNRTCPYCGGRKDKLEFLCYYSLAKDVYWSDYRHALPQVGVPSLVQRCPHCGKLFAIEAEGVLMTDTADFEWIDPVTWDYYKQSYEEFSALEKSELIDYNHRMRIRCAFNDEFCRTQCPPHPTDEDLQIFKDNMLHLIPYVGEPLDQAEAYREAGMFAECVEVLDHVAPDSEPTAAYANHLRRLAQAQNPWPFGWRTK